MAPVACGGAPAGVLYGYNTASQGLVHWDRFAQDNHNAVILGRSGSGKSYLVKLEVLRSLYRGIDAHVIDPEDEYTRLASAVGGTFLGGFAAPWAKDAHGNPVPTSYRVDGSTLVQSVRIADSTAFPVVADPKWLDDAAKGVTAGMIGGCAAGALAGGAGCVPGAVASGLAGGVAGAVGGLFS
ncbi:helicase HerA domain-containing protein [Streptomyces sp. NPDC059788]|uniref:helicase HerA domain-containing protein n=1 Tax=Streptomyces sp. NPDC059788 TaxID=3346948 RepID=UPI00365032F0